MSAEQPSGEWRPSVHDLVEAVRFDPQPVDATDRLMELIVATDVLPGDPQGYLVAVRGALTDTTPIASVVPQPHTEGALRKLLRVLEERLDDWVRNGPAIVPLPLAEWRPSGAPVVAHLGREPEFLERWLGVDFEDVADAIGAVRIAVLRLRSERVVALMQVVGNPAPGTSLLQADSRPSDEVVAGFLNDTKLSRSVIESASPDKSVEP